MHLRNSVYAQKKKILNSRVRRCKTGHSEPTREILFHSLYWDIYQRTWGARFSQILFSVVSGQRFPVGHGEQRDPVLEGHDLLRAAHGKINSLFIIEHFFFIYWPRLKKKRFKYF